MGAVLSVSELRKAFHIRKGIFSARQEDLLAVDGITFSVARGETVGVVGESGSGKSTLARCVMLLEEPDSGTVTFLGKELTALSGKEFKGLRRDMQMIFQDPYSSLNPRKKVLAAIGEPMRYHGIAGPGEVKGAAAEMLRRVGLDENFLDKYPHEMSGGQRQRVAIGRALATRPRLVVADEPVSSLDVSIQAQIINLFMDIRETLDLAMLFVSHDLHIVRFVADRIVVMYRGRVVESGVKDEVFYHPLHPYTEMLIEAARGTYSETGDDGADVQDQCPFYGRCRRRSASCLGGHPELRGTPEHSVACPNA